MKKIVETSEIVVSHRDASIPFSYLDGNQQPVGYALDICLHVADAVKKELHKDGIATRLSLVNAATRILLLLNGTVDMECGSTTNTVDRQSQVAFSKTYFVAGNRILTKKDSGINGLNDLRGKTVASNSGTTNMKQLIEINGEKKLGMNVIAGKDLAESFLLLETDRAAALVMDDILLSSLAANSKQPDDYHIVGEPLSIEPYAIMIRRDDPQFKAIVDRTMVELMRSGEIEALYRKWFQSPIPPRGITLGLEPSDVLKRAWANPTDSANADDYR
nr:amino acid ABC transporter substrate-binding protein [Chelatococcus asaccharovorans]